MTDRIAWLDGQELDGTANGFSIIGQVCKFLKQLGHNRESIEEFQRKAMDNDNAGMLQYITDTTGITFTMGDDDDCY